MQSGRRHSCGGPSPLRNTGLHPPPQAQPCLQSPPAAPPPHCLVPVSGPAAVPSTPSSPAVCSSPAQARGRCGSVRVSPRNRGSGRILLSVPSAPHARLGSQHSPWGKDATTDPSLRRSDSSGGGVCLLICLARLDSSISPWRLYCWLLWIPQEGGYKK